MKMEHGVKTGNRTWTPTCRGRLQPTFLDGVFPMAVGVVRQVTHQRVMRVGVPAAQALHLSGRVRAAPPAKFP